MCHICYPLVIMSIPEPLPESKEIGGTAAWEGKEGLTDGVMVALRGLFQDKVLVAVILLTGTLCFGLGLIIDRESREPEDALWIEQLPASGAASATTTSQGGKGSGPAPQPAAVGEAVRTSGTYVASKSGTKYYLPSCSGAKRIKVENRVWFETKGEAEAAGYEPATGCKGL
jgi:hypothetical protein